LLDQLSGPEPPVHFWLSGGRGSGKSSFVSLAVAAGVMENPGANAIILRKVGKYLRESVYEQMLWAIDALGVADDWETKVSLMELTYLPTGGRIIFRGADNPRKIKSTKLQSGYFRYIWFEELDEFAGMGEIRNILQTVMRGGDGFSVFYTYNPPKSVRSWVNAEALNKPAGRVTHHSSYLTVPREWLGEQFFLEAERLRAVNPASYAHEYLGEVTGTGGEVFSNLTLREIPESEIAAFDRIRRGIDFGYAVDPFVYLVLHYDKTRRKIYIYHEICKAGLSNRAAVELIRLENVSNSPVTADSAEPKSIREMRDSGLKIKGAKKGPDSVEYGIKLLQDMEEIVIDPVRCPNAAREFTNYEYQRDKDGNYSASFPDRDNHTIDAARYALEDDMSDNRGKAYKRRDFGGLL